MPKEEIEHPYKLESDCVVLACSGPSLNKVDVFSLGYPVIAVSTAIRANAFEERKPHIWALADKLNDHHSELGQEIYKDPDVLKVLPELRRKDLRRFKNLKEEELEQWMFCHYQSNRQKHKRKQQQPFTGTMPFIRGPHKSVTFALQWAHFMGAKTIIWAGCDLTATNISDKYAYKTNRHDTRKQGGYMRTLNVVTKCLHEWYPIAKENGFEWYNWDCGEVLESVGLPPFLGKGTQKKIIVSIPDTPKKPIMGVDTNRRSVNRRGPVREISLRQNKRRARLARKTTVKESRISIPDKEKIKDGIIDKYGRHITEPFVDPVAIGGADVFEMGMLANLPNEKEPPPTVSPVYNENLKEQKKETDHAKKKLREKHIRRRQLREQMRKSG